MTEEEFASYLIADMQKAECGTALVQPMTDLDNVHVDGTFNMREIAASMMERFRVDAISVLPNGRHMLRINDSWFDGPEVAV